MSIQLSTFFCLCLALAIPLLVLSTANHDLQEDIASNLDHDINRFAASNQRGQHPSHSFLSEDDYNNQDRFLFKKAADFEQILKPCNRMPASGRGQEYADCVRNRMLLMGRRKRRQAI